MSEIKRIVLDDPSDFLDWRRGSGPTVEIFDIQVGSLRRRGRGRELVRRLLSEIPEGTRTVWAITRASNLIAHDFYHGLGFHAAGYLREFYRDEETTPSGVDAILYALEPERGVEKSP